MTAADKRPFTFDRVIRILITAGFLAGFVWLISYLSDVLLPFAIAVLMAYLTNPLVLLIQKKISSRSTAVFISLFAIIIVAVLAGWIIIPMVSSEIVQMGRIMTKLANDAELARKAADLLPPDIIGAVKDFASRPDVQDLFKSEKLWQTAALIAKKLLPGIWGVISGTASFIIGLVGLAVIALYCIFLLIDYEAFSRGWKDMIPPAYRDSVIGFVNDFEAAMSNYFRGQAAIASICGILFAIGFALIGLPLGILLGLFIGLLNMVPYLQLIGVIPAVLLAVFHSLESGTGIWLVLGLTGVVFAAVQVVQDVLLTPKIMGKVTGMNPAMIMLSLSIWGKLLGFLGLIIALPLTCLLMVYYRRFLSTSVVETHD